MIPELVLLSCLTEEAVKSIFPIHDVASKKKSISDLMILTFLPT